MKRVSLFLLVLLICIKLFAVSEQQRLVDYLDDNNYSNYEVIVTEDSLIYAQIKKEDTSTYLVLSSDNLEVHGYEGKTKVALFFDSLANILEVKIVKSRDTRSFVKRLKSSNFLEQFVNWKGKGEIVSKTGVTFTSDSVTQTVKNLIPYINRISKIINQQD